jgi:hypothetical protein
MHLRRARVVARSFAAGAQLLTLVCTVGACGKKQLGAGLRWPCRGQACGGMLGAMARVAPAGGTARSTEPKPPCGLQIVQQNFKFSWARLFEKSGSSRPQPSSRTQNFTFTVAAISAGPTCNVASFEV